MTIVRFSECTQQEAIEFFMSDGCDIDQAIDASKMIFKQNSREWDEGFEAQIVFRFGD